MSHCLCAADAISSDLCLVTEAWKGFLALIWQGWEESGRLLKQVECSLWIKGFRGFEAYVVRISSLTFSESKAIFVHFFGQGTRWESDLGNETSSTE